MGLVHRKKDNYLIGFDQRANCGRVYELIRNLIREKYKMKKSKITQSSEKVYEEQKIVEKRESIKYEKEDII